MTKSTKNQNIGGKGEAKGSAYQAFSTTFLALRMFLYDDYKIIKPNGKGPIDDIQVEDRENNDIYFQCKVSEEMPYKGKIKGVLKDFYRQYIRDSVDENTTSKYVLFCLYPPPKLIKILDLVLKEPEKGRALDEYIQEELSKDTKELYNEVYKELSQHTKEFSEESIEESKASLDSDKLSVSKENLSREDYINFLKRVKVWPYSFRAVKDDLYDQLKRSGYPEYVYHVLNTTFLYDWSSRGVEKKDINDLLANLGIKVISKDASSVGPSTKKKEYVRSKDEFILFKVDEKFYKKLQFILDLISSKSDFSKNKKDFIIEALIENTTLAWHFLKNLSRLNKIDWFPIIKDNVIKSIVEQDENSAVKFQLLNYFETCAAEYSEQILPLIDELERNTKNYNILSNLAKTLGKLRPKRKKSIKLLWKIFSRLTEHQHPWVRREIPKALLPFVEEDADKVLELLKKVLLYTPPPKDVTQGSPTLALTFQGRDNENWVFEEAIGTLSKLLKDPEYAGKAFDLAIKVEIRVIKAEEKDHDIKRGVTLDQSYIWLGDKSFEKLEYNHNRKERVVLEIEKALDELSKSNKKLVTSLLKKLLNRKYEVFHLAVIKTLTRNISDFQALAETLVFDTKIWGIYNLRNYYLQNLITKYFELNKGQGLKKFIELVDKYKEKDKKRTLYTKQDLLISIPENLRSAEVKKELNEISKKLKSKPKVTKPFVVTSWSGPRPDISIEELQKKNDDKLIQIMTDSSSRKRAGAWDVAPSFASLIDRNPEKLKDLLPKMKDKKLEPGFAGEMVSAYIKKNPKKISDIIGFISQLSPTDTWARIEIARYLNGICRKKEIKEYNQNSLKKIKNALFALSEDGDPETDETIKSNRPKPDDAITRGINSVRGITAEALVAFSHYFPKDEEVIKKIKELAEDKTNAVKATLIYNMRYLIERNYLLCEEVINKFKTQRDPEIDFALIHFFAKIDCQKFIEQQSFIKSIFENDHEKINEKLGELIGYRYVSCCEVQALVDEIKGGRKGTKDTRRSLAFVFESQLANVIGEDKGIKIASCLKEFLKPQNDFEIVERASFLFEREEIKPQHFEFLDDNGLIEQVIKNERNIPAQSHLVNYLHKCVESNIEIERCLEVLFEQVTEVEPLLSDHLIARKIAEIVRKLIKECLSDQSKKHLTNIFDKGLERGWDEFYEIYKDYKTEWEN